ncbi:hypothetical protein [Streptomyces sp. NPDC017202]|uniref:hypothetical protein n=1 Tax=Streptomyces sp. NPDC017202 TaxID=3364981 RepID=UPI0037A532F4
MTTGRGFDAVGLGAGHDRPDAGHDRPDAGHDRFGAGHDRFGAGHDRFGAGHDRFGAGHDRPGASRGPGRGTHGAASVRSLPVEASAVPARPGKARPA